MSSPIAAQPGQYLVFELAGQSYGVPIGMVREINRVADITPVPQTPKFVEGVMNLRGKVIPVINLRLKFQINRAEFTKQTCVIVLESEIGLVGTIVDSVKGVTDFIATQIEPTPKLGDDKTMQYVMGIGKGETVTILVNVPLALSSDHFLKELQKEALSQTDHAA